MAKPKDETVTTEQPGVAPAVPVVIYRDKLYTSRTLILPGDRSLPVLKARVVVPESDTEALAYLKGSAEHEQLKE